MQGNINIPDKSASWTPVLQIYNVDEIVHMDEESCLTKASNKLTGQRVYLKYIHGLKQSPLKRTQHLIRELQIMHELTNMPANDFTVKLLGIIIPKVESSGLGSRSVSELFIVYECKALDLQSLQDTGDD